MTSTTAISMCTVKTKDQLQVKQGTEQESSNTDFTDVMYKASYEKKYDNTDKNTLLKNKNEVKMTDAKEMDADTDQENVVNENVQSTTKISDEDVTSTTKMDEAENVVDCTDDMDESIMEEIILSLTQMSQNMVNIIAEKLDVSVEEVKNMMQQLGIQSEDLLQPQQVKNLVLGLEGDTEGSSMLTDENLFMTVNELFGTLQDFESDLRADMDMGQDEIQKIVQQFSNISSSQQSEKKQENASLDVELPKFTDVKDLYAVEKNLSNVIRNDKESQSDNINIVSQNMSEQLNSKTQNNVFMEAEQKRQMLLDAETEIVPLGNEKQESNGTESQLNGQNNSFLQNFIQNNAQASEVQMQETQSTFEMQNTTELIDQIVEYMKVQVKSDVSQLEMQLHPESLGTLTIHLTAKEGVMTAQFTTQNEDVRAIIQSQIVELKQNLEAQGLKVSAVEVTVANYSQGDGSTFSNNNQTQQQKSSEKRRNIDLTLLTEDMELLDDSEQLAAQIMINNGNTVDYMA